jgi:hypothetical protein
MRCSLLVLGSVGCGLEVEGPSPRVFLLFICVCGFARVIHGLLVSCIFRTLLLLNEIRAIGYDCEKRIIKLGRDNIRSVTGDDG